MRRSIRRFLNRPRAFFLVLVFILLVFVTIVLGQNKGSVCSCG